MKTNITPELKQAIADSIERSKSIVIKPFTPYVSKPEPRHNPIHRHKLDAFRSVMERCGLC